MQNNFSKCREWVPRGTSQHKWRWLTTLLLILTLGIGQMWGAASTTSDDATASGTITFDEVGTLSAQNTYWYNGLKFYEQSTNSMSADKSKRWSAAITPCQYGTFTSGVNWEAGAYDMTGLIMQAHCLAVNVSSACTIEIVVNMSGKALGQSNPVVPGNLKVFWDGTAYDANYTSSTYKTGTAKTDTTWTQNINGKYNRMKLSIPVTAADLEAKTIDVIKVSYTGSATGTPSYSQAFVYESVKIVPASSGPVDPTINTTNGAYTINGTALDLTTCVSSNNTTGAFSFAVKTDGDTDASIDGSSFTANYAGTCVVTATQAAVSGTWNQKSVDFNVVVSAAATPVDPTFVYVASSYTVGDPALDLSTVLTSNSTGAITFAVSTSDAGTTGASIANDKDFTATTAGTATITVSQAAATGYNAKTQDITVTVQSAPAAPDVVLNDNGTLNSTDFVTLVTSLDETDYTVESTAFDNNFKFGNTASAFVNKSWSNCYLAYDVKTTSATLKLYVYNKNSNSKYLYYQVLSETGNGDLQTETITSKGDGKIIEIPVTATKGTRVVFGANSTDVRICQLEVYETGTTLPLAAQVGYEVAMKGRPFATGGSNLFSGNIDGMEYVLYSELKLVNSNAYSVMRNNDGTHYFKIPATNDVQLKVTTENSAKFYVLGSAVAGDPDKDVQYGGEAGTFNVNLPHKDGYWYIIPVVAATGTGNEVRISKIAFATLPAGKHVTYSAGEGSVKEGKSLPTHADAWEGDKITLASGENLERGGYDFSGWKANGTGDLLKVGDKYTMTNDDVQFVAQWTEHIAKYGVKFMDGATKLDSLSVTIGEAPVFANPTKALNSFAGWKDGEDNAVTLSDLATSVTVEDTKLVLYAQWTKAYVPQGASYVFENTATVGTTHSITVTKDNQPNAIAADSRIDNMWLSAMSVKLEDGTYSGSGDDFKGWKINTASATIRFYVENDSRVTVTVGNLTSGLNIKYTAKNATEEATTALTAKAANPYDVKGGTLVTLTTGGGSTVTLKGIAVSAIPALDDDATLSDLKVGGLTVAGFSANTHTYYYELPYGTAVGDIPAISATANSAKAKQVAIEQAVWTGDPYNCYRAQANVQAEDESWGYYDVQFSFAPKYGVELIKATHDGTASGATITGYIGGQKDKDTYANGKLGEIGKYFGIKLADGNFQAGDLVEVKVSMFEGGNTATMFTDKGETPLSSGAFDVNNKVYRFTLTAETEWIYIYRKDGTCNPRVQSIAVYRQMAPFIEEFKIGDAVGTINGTNIAVEVPYNADLEHLTPAIKYWANGNAQISPAIDVTDFTSSVDYTVSSSYAEDATGAYAPVTYTVTVTKEPHYVAKIGTTGYTSLAAALEHAADGEIVLLEDIDVTAQIEIAAGVTATIDLAGYKIEYTGTETLPSGVILVHNGASLTINDSSDPDAGKIVAGENAYAATAMTKAGDDPANPAILIVNGGTLTGYYYGITGNGSRPNTQITINGGTINATATNDNLGIYHPQNGTLTVTGGTITGYASAIEMRAGTLVIEDGTFTATATSFSCNPNGSGTTTVGAAIAIAQHTTKTDITVTIEGGTFNGVKAINESNPQANDPAPQVDMDVTDGTFHGAIATVDVNNFISGGTFDNEVTADQCAEGYAPTSWTVGTETKYGVHFAGVIRGAASTNSDGVYYYTLDNDVTIFSSESDGRLKASNHIATSSDIEPCGGDKGGYNVNQSKFVLKFPVNVKEFTLYGANSTERTISKVYVNAEASKDIKISNVGRELTGTYSNTKDGKCQTLTAEYAGENVIAANDYVLVTLSGTANIYRILYTEAECTDPVITAVNNAIGTVGESATVSVEATALGATYQWYTCDENGDNAEIIGTATAASYTFTKGAGVEYFKVVVGNNCNTATVSAVAKAEVWAPTTTLVDVTENTTWDWTLVTSRADGSAIDDSDGNGPKLNTTNGMIIGNYIIGNNFDKVEGNDGAFAIRNASNKYYQGASLHMHTTVSGYLKIHARNDGNTMTLSVQNAGRDMSLGSLGNWKDYTVYVQAGDVVIYNVPETAGKPMRIDHMEFTVDETPDHTRDIATLNIGNIGTLCVDHNVPVGGMVGATFYQIAGKDEYGKIAFDEVDSLVAGEPYIFQSHTNLLTLYYGNVTADEAVVKNGMHGYLGDANYTLDIDESNKTDIMYIANNRLWNCEDLVGIGLTVVPNRCYIVYSAVSDLGNNSTPNNGRKRVFIGGASAPQTATGLENLVGGEQAQKLMINGQLYILRGEKLFDATGRLVK